MALESQYYEVQLDNTMVTSYPLGSETLGNQGLNDLYQFNQAKPEVSFLTSNDVLLSQLSDSETAQVSRLGDGRMPQSHQGSQQVGPLDVLKDANGDPVVVSTLHADYFYKTPDGKWTLRTPDGKETEVAKVQVDDKGNLSYDVEVDGVVEHRKQNADGTSSRESSEIGGTISYDKDGNVTETPSGKGRMRDYHYTNGQLDKINGNLGQWERVEKDGQVSWVNKEKNLTWEGDFKVNPETGDLIFQARAGVVWGFSTRGDQTRVQVTG